MSTPFQSALQKYVSAERDYAWSLHSLNEEPTKDVDAADRALSQAGDVLEGELRWMMRDAVLRAPFPKQ